MEMCEWFCWLLLTVISVHLSSFGTEYFVDWPFLFAHISKSMVELDFQVLLHRYQLGERVFRNVLVKAIDGFESDLKLIDLEASILVKAYLPYSNLSQAQLRRLVVKEGNLCDANLQSTDLTEASLNDVDLSRTNLCFACLKEATLQGANLSGADLQGADLTGANLVKANLTGANLEQARLDGTILTGATLFRATGANLRDAVCDRTTVLPDGHYL
jgi:uncharacterized protein YjbI with pentapeptide repeats